MSDASSLTHFYLGWSRQNDRLLQALAPLTPDQLLLRSALHMWPVSVLAAHIISTRVFWFHTIMGEGPAALDTWLGLDDVDESERTLDRLLGGLTASWALIEEVLARHTPAHLDDVFERVYPNRVKTFTRQAILLHVLGHDFHHGGEISTTLGMHGLAGLEE
jgi:uncharacterized damage-inducible protein DinB